MRALLACGAALALGGSTLIAQTGTGTFRASDGTTIHFEQVGSGDTLVLLAGGPGFTPVSVKPVCDELARTRRCVLLHQRGTGLSTAAADRPDAITLRRFVADIDALRQALALERVTLVGHSWGGMLAMAYAAAHPDQTRAIVLIASGGPTLDYMSWYDKNAQARVNEQDKAIAAYWEGQRASGADPVRVAAGLLAAGMSSTFHDRTKVRELADSLGDRAFNSVVFDQMMQDLRSTGYDLRAPLRSFSRPVLIVQGRQDPIATVETLRRTFPSARPVVELVENAGHFLWLEQPLPLFRAVASFLGKLR